LTPSIPYALGGASRKAADCQGLVEGCIKEAGGKADYAGSNDMLRACYKSGNLWTLTQAQKLGKLKPGALVFILDNDGKEPPQYRADKLGNASHVGVYVGQSDTIWSVDASASAGKVRTRTKRDAPYVWTHVGFLPEIEAEADETLDLKQSAGADPAGADIARNVSVSDSYPAEYIVLATSLNLRRLPSVNSDIRGRAAHGSILTITGTRQANGRDWGETKTKGSDGKMISCFAAMDDGAGVPYLRRVAEPAPTSEVSIAQAASTPQSTKPDRIDTLSRLVDMAIKLNELE
jgi:hypothetical protein